MFSKKYDIECEVCQNSRTYRSFGVLYLLNTIKAWCINCKDYTTHEIISERKYEK